MFGVAATEYLLTRVERWAPANVKWLLSRDCCGLVIENWELVIVCWLG